MATIRKNDSGQIACVEIQGGTGLWMSFNDASKLIEILSRSEQFKEVDYELFSGDAPFFNVRAVTSERIQYCPSLFNEDPQR